MRRHRPRVVAVAGLTVVLLGALCLGCGDGGKPGRPARPAEKRAEPVPGTIAYPSELSPDSSPSEVAAVLIKALDQRNKKVVQGLAAAKAGAQAVEAIYRKHGKTKTVSAAQGARLTAAGWAVTYSFYQKGATQVVREEVTGDTAVVHAQGKSRDGKTRPLVIRLVREDDVWKVRAGQK